MLDNKEIARRALTRAGELKAQKKKRKIYFTSGISMAVCAAAIIYVVMIFSKGAPTKEPYIYIPDTQIPFAALPVFDEIKPCGSGNETDGMLVYCVPKYDRINIPVGTTVVGITLSNPESNPYCFSFEITLASMGETLFISDLIAPSMKIEKVELERPLDAGEYDALLITRAYAMDCTHPVSETRAEFTLIVG